LVRKTLRGVLSQADPNLKIIPGRIYTHRERPATDKDWDDAAGVVCKKCGREVFRSRDGLCMSCWEAQNELDVRDGTGITDILPREVIMEICKKPGSAK
jgi:hypothetical protein